MAFGWAWWPGSPNLPTPLPYGPGLGLTFVAKRVLVAVITCELSTVVSTECFCTHRGGLRDRAHARESACAQCLY
eukprot:904555-Amphidinium_carterae.1